MRLQYHLMRPQGLFPIKVLEGSNFLKLFQLSWGLLSGFSWGGHINVHDDTQTSCLQPGFLILTLPVISIVALGQQHCCSVPQFPRPQLGVEMAVQAIRGCWPYVA